MENDVYQESQYIITCGDGCGSGTTTPESENWVFFSDGYGNDEWFKDLDHFIGWAKIEFDLR